jgi:nucleoside 2-deoxyribosyltransferase
VRVARAAKPRVYLAGPDVFAVDRDAIFARLTQACDRAGLIGLPPADGGARQDLTPFEQAKWIYQKNIELLQQADAVMANVNGFRGVEPDSGTAFEIGYAAAMGKPVALVLADPKCWEARVAEAFGSQERNGALFDEKFGALIEAFKLPVNLMLAFGSCVWARTPEEAAEGLAKRIASAGGGAFRGGPRALAQAAEATRDAESARGG